MNNLKHIASSVVILYTLLLLGVTTAAPQWHNSTDGHQYLIEGDQKYNWFQAQHECARKNLQLVEIDTQQKNGALVVLLKSIFGNSHNLWIGAMDEYNRDKNFHRPFYWSSSGKSMTFSYWSNDNPDNDRHDEHCAHTYASAPDFRWNDHHCDTARLGYICEEHYLHNGVLKAVTDKQKTLSDLISKLSREYQEHQQQQMDKLEKAMKDIEDGENELKEVLQSIQTKLEYDITHALAQNQREIKSVIGDRDKKIRSLNVEMKSAAEVLNKKMTKELQAVQDSLKNLMKV